MRPRIKICGITCAADALAAVAAGADVLGVNLWPQSKRFLPLERAGWLRDLPVHVSRVAVMVNPSLQDALTAAENPDLDAIQLHGDEPASLCVQLESAGIPVIKAIRIRDAGSFAVIPSLPSAVTVLLDTFQSGTMGGTGATFDWALAHEFRVHGGRAFFLSGGLTPLNVSDAYRRVRPDGVDVASGVEVAADARRKDHRLMRAFVEALGSGAEGVEKGPKLFDRDTAKKA